MKSLGSGIATMILFPGTMQRVILVVVYLMEPITMFQQKSPMELMALHMAISIFLPAIPAAGISTAVAVTLLILTLTIRVGNQPMVA